MADVIAQFRAWMKEEPKTPCMTDVPDGPLSALLDVAESSQKLSAALTACEPYFQTAAVLMQRMGPYTGPTFGAEHESLRAALARLEGRA